MSCNMGFAGGRDDPECPLNEGGGTIYVTNRADIVAAFNAYESARDFFNAASRSVARLNAVQQLLASGDVMEQSGHRGGAKASHSDPTASRAIYEVETAAERIRELQREEEALTDFIGYALVLIEGVRNGLGDRYADVLDCRYIDRMEWPHITQHLGVSRRAALLYRNVACEWMDSVGGGNVMRLAMG